MLRLGGPLRGCLCFALREAEGAPAGGYARYTKALDHWRARVCRSQTSEERHQGKKGRPLMAKGCDTSQGELSREECLLSEAAEHS